MKKLFFSICLLKFQFCFADRYVPSKEYLRSETEIVTFYKNPKKFKNDITVRESISSFFQKKYNDKKLFDVSSLQAYYYLSSRCGVYYAASTAAFNGASAYSKGCKSGSCDYYFFKLQNKSLIMIYQNSFSKLFVDFDNGNIYSAKSQPTEHSPDSPRFDEKKVPLDNDCLIVGFEKYEGNKKLIGTITIGTKKTVLKYGANTSKKNKPFNPFGK